MADRNNARIFQLSAECIRDPRVLPGRGLSGEAVAEPVVPADGQHLTGVSTRRSSALGKVAVVSWWATSGSMKQHERLPRRRRLMKVPENLDHMYRDVCVIRAPPASTWCKAISSGSSTTKSSSCGAGGAVKCSPAKVHTGVIESFFQAAHSAAARDGVSGGQFVRGARPQTDNSYTGRERGKGDDFLPCLSHQTWLQKRNDDMTVEAQLRKRRCLMTGCLTIAGLFEHLLGDDRSDGRRIARPITPPLSPRPTAPKWTCRPTSGATRSSS